MAEEIKTSHKPDNERGTESTLTPGLWLLALAVCLGTPGCPAVGAVNVASGAAHGVSDVHERASCWNGNHKGAAGGKHVTSACLPRGAQMVAALPPP